MALSTCIKLNTSSITQQRVVIDSVSFHLDREKLIQIRLARKKKRSLSLSPMLIADFRYYVLFDRTQCLQSELCFCTYFQERNQEEIVIKSIIAPEGKIIQQITSKYLSDREFMLTLVSTHYWLVEQMLSQLPLPGKTNRKWLVWTVNLFVSLLTGGIFWLTVLSRLDLIYPLQFGLFLLLFLLVEESIRRWLLPYLIRWWMNQLLFGLWSYRAKNKQLGWEFLANFGW